MTLAVASCSSMDGLTPPEPIGNVSDQASAANTVSPDDLASMARNQASDQSTGQMTAQTQTDVPVQPEQTLAGEEDQQVQPQSPTSPMLGSPGGISATRKSIYGNAEPKALYTAPTTAPASAAAPQGTTAIRFLPIIGAPLEAVRPLSRELAVAAQAHGLTIKPSNDQSAGHMLKGYFSASGDGPNTDIIYVWDVLDSQGNRLTRISGQEKIPGNSGKPWSNVPPDVMKKIASETIASYVSWASGQAG